MIHQEGKRYLQLVARVCRRRSMNPFTFAPRYQDLLGSQVQIESRVDKSTFGGRTTLTLSPMLLDSTLLAELPLVPSNLADHPVQGTLEAQLQVEHPANEVDYRKHAIDLRAKVSGVVSTEYGPLSNGIDLRAIQRDGRASLVVEGPFAKGQLQLNTQLDLASHVPELTATYKLTGVDLEPYARMFASKVRVAAIASAEGDAHAAWQNNVLTFRAALAPKLTAIHADGIPIGDLITTIACDGYFAPNRKQPLAGSLKIETASDGVALQAVSRRFAIGSAEGQVGFQGSGIIPLATLADVQTYNAGIGVHSGLLACEGMTIQPVSLSARLENGMVDVKLPQTTLGVVANRPPNCLVDRLQLADTFQLQTQFESSVSITRLLEPDAWTAVSNVSVQGLAVAPNRSATSRRLVV